MPDRPDCADFAADADDQRLDEPPSEVESEVIVAPYHPGRQSAKLLPPILIVLLGACFLVFRAQRSDWQGLSGLVGSLTWNRPARATEKVPPPPLAHKTEQPALAASPEVKPERDAQAKADAAKPKQPDAADPLDDIRKEAEETKKKIAELEDLKEREKEKLDATAPERERADRLARRDDLEKLLKVQREQLRRQMAMMAEFQRQQFDRMLEHQRQFFGQNRRGFAQPPMPFAMPDFGPGFGFGRGFGLDPAPNERELQPGKEQFRRLPNGGFERYRTFRGPGGMSGFTWELRSGGPDMAPDADDGQPKRKTPPPPRPRIID
jgi:hypothetical protein